MTPAGIAFDAFGTLFDLDALRGRAEAVVGDAGGQLTGALPERLIPLMWHATVAGRYRSFPEMATLALLAIARERGIELDCDGAEKIAAGLASRRLPRRGGRRFGTLHRSHSPCHERHPCRNRVTARRCWACGAVR